MRSFSEHCAYLGFPLRNVRWSWCALSSDKSRVLFTIWADEVKERRFVVYPIAVRRPGPIGAAADLKAGGREVEEVANYAADTAGVAAFGVLCTAADPTAVPRVRKHFDERTLFALRIYRDGATILADIIDRVPAERLAPDV